MADVDTELKAETIKLLVQVACANDHIHPKERELIAKLAKTWKVSETADTLFDHLERGAPLPQPNLKILRAGADEVIRAAEALASVDGEVDEDEADILTQVKMLLGRA